MPIPERIDRVDLEPGQKLTLEDIHRMLPKATRIEGNALVVLRAIHFRRAPEPAQDQRLRNIHLNPLWIRLLNREPETDPEPE